MSSKPVDSKLARQLQKRGSWNSYSSCLREVQSRLVKHPPNVVREIIDKGELDAPKAEGPSRTTGHSTE